MNKEEKEEIKKTLDKDNLSIKSRIAKLVIRIFFWMFITIGAGLGAIFTGFFMHQSNGRQEIEAMALRETATHWYLQQETQVGLIVANVEESGVLLKDAETIRDYLAKSLAQNKSVYDYYICLNDDTAYFGGSWQPTKEEYQPTTRDWYKKAYATEDVIYSEPYVDADSGRIVITFAKKLHLNGEAAGVLAADVFIDELFNITNNLFDSSHRYAVLVSREGMVLTHTNPALVPHADASGNTVSYTYKTLGIPEKLIGVDGLVSKFTIVPANGGLCAHMASYSKEYGISCIAVSDWWSYSGGVVIFALCTVGLIIVFISTAGFLTRRNVQPMLEPLNELMLVADNMNRGVLDYKAQYREEDEIGTLCTAIESSNAAIKGYIKDISETLSGMSEGDFTVSITSNYHGDFKPLKTSINSIAEALRTSFTQLSEAAKEVYSSADTVTKGTESLTGDVQSVSELVAAVDEKVRLVREEFDESRKITEASLKLSQEAEEGITVSRENMEELLKAMEVISEKSNGIAEIIAIINGIADETNLLALNASIEAARAGAAGAGFAVVAESVRHLSEQTAEAAANTGELIKEAVDAVNAGSTLVQKSSDNMNSIVEKNNEVDAQIKRIVETIDRENVIVSDMADTFRDMATLTDNTKDTAQACLDKTTNLNEQSEAMEKIIGKFTI